MTTSSLEPAPGWLRDLAAARARYEEQFGWPVAVLLPERRLVLALGQVVDAVTMPAGLGTRVQTQLAIAMLAGPVILDPGRQRWTFLAQPDPTFRGDLGEVVANHGVRREAVGTCTAVPVADSDPRARWVTPPRPNHVLPSIYAVVATTRRVCAAMSAA